MNENDNDKAIELRMINPEMDVVGFTDQKSKMLDLISKQMKSGQDYGVIPGTSKKSLYQPGAEKLAKFFGLSPNYTLTKEIETPIEGFVYYRYKCELIHIATQIKVGDAERSCNSKEPKFSKKSAFEMMNTCQGMAQKRALVAAVRTATMATDIFTDDIAGDGEKPGSTNQTESPIRVNLMKRFMAVATARGFDEDRIHEIVLPSYGVKSRTELTNQQINDITEKLQSNYKIVAKGSAPIRLKTEEKGGEDK